MRLADLRLNLKLVTDGRYSNFRTRLSVPRLGMNIFISANVGIWEGFILYRTSISLPFYDVSIPLLRFYASMIGSFCRLLFVCGRFSSPDVIVKEDILQNW